MICYPMCFRNYSLFRGNLDKEDNFPLTKLSSKSRFDCISFFSFYYMRSRIARWSKASGLSNHIFLSMFKSLLRIFHLSLYSKTLKMVASKVVDLPKWRLVFSFHFSKMEEETLQNVGFFLWQIVKPVLLHYQSL